MNIIEINDLSRKELDVYARLSERQLATYFEPDLGLFLAESPKVIRRAIDAGYCPVSFLVERYQMTRTKEVIELLQYIKARLGELAQKMPIYTAEDSVLSALTGFHLTRGMLCVMKRKPLCSMEELIANKKRIAILEEVVNPTNVGAIFRNAAALGMDGILLTSGCADPLYRRALRVSMGTVFQVPWTMLNHREAVWPDETMHLLAKYGFKTAAMALKEESVPIDHKDLSSQEKLAIVLGTEGDGLKTSTIANCDYTVLIPMAHGVDSLNVAAASAVAFWQLGRR